jgi:1H-pyrrole-2-carbonyl-[peptidyl-carrier protein] brominase
VKTDVAIVGAGPAGSTAAMRLADEGIDCVIVEKLPFPRYHIGESMTGEAGGVLRGLGLEDRMLRAGHPIKHGVNVYGSSAWFVPVMQRTDDGELRDQATWQVTRSMFDAMLLDEALRRGAAVLPGKALRPLVSDDGAVRGLRVRTADGELDVAAEITLDCSGQSTFLACHGVTGPKYMGSYDKQIAVFSQVPGFELHTAEPGRRDTVPGNTLIFYKAKFHWAWAIPIDDELVSVGVVIPSQYFVDSGETREAFLRRELRELHPELARRAPEIEFAEEVRVIPNYSFQVRKFAGKAFICLGDAHRFVDPIFSFGVHVALHEAAYATDIVKRYLEGEGRDSDDLFTEHMINCERRADVFEDLIDGFWENPLAFAVMAHGRRFRDSVIDIFAGRNAGEDGQTTGALPVLRRLLKRERSYDDDGLYSVPVGSRFHPERAPLWNSVLDSVESTEAWIREQ